MFMLAKIHVSHIYVYDITSHINRDVYNSFHVDVKLALRVSISYDSDRAERYSLSWTTLYTNMKQD